MRDINITIYNDPLIKSVAGAMADSENFKKKINEIMDHQKGVIVKSINKTKISTHLSDEVLDEYYKYKGLR